MNNFWKDFWSQCGPAEAKSEADFFKQAALTVNKQPIPNDLFVRMLEHIVTQLGLTPQDHLLDFCCGNGLFTYELAAHVSKATGIDFVPRNIRTAQLQKSRPNTAYVIGDATAPLSGPLAADAIPNKFLMNNSLGYFTPSQLDAMLGNILQQVGNREFRFLLTGIPNIDLKWNFYDTPERRARHLENLEKEKDSLQINDGVGRWWRAAEIEEACRRHGLAGLIENQPPGLSNYRMDALIVASVDHR